MTGQSTHAEPQPGADPLARVWLRRPGGSPEPITIPTDGSLRVGRQNDNDLTLDSSKISRYHIDIKFDGNHYFVTDQHSKNGAFLGGRRLPAGEATLWPPEQVVALGRSGYTFQLNQDIQGPSSPTRRRTVWRRRVNSNATTKLKIRAISTVKIRSLSLDDALALESDERGVPKMPETSSLGRNL